MVTRRDREMPGREPVLTFERKNSYSYDELIECGHGRLFGPGNAQLPLPPMLMMDRIPRITDEGGEHGKGEIVAALEIGRASCREKVCQSVQISVGHVY